MKMLTGRFMHEDEAELSMPAFEPNKEYTLFLGGCAPLPEADLEGRLSRLDAFIKELAPRA